MAASQVEPLIAATLRGAVPRPGAVARLLRQARHQRGVARAATLAAAERAIAARLASLSSVRLDARTRANLEALRARVRHLQAWDAATPAQGPR